MTRVDHHSGMKKAAAEGATPPFTDLLIHLPLSLDFLELSVNHLLIGIGC